MRIVSVGIDLGETAFHLVALGLAGRSHGLSSRITICLSDSRVPARFVMSQVQGGRIGPSLIRSGYRFAPTIIC